MSSEPVISDEEVERVYRRVLLSEDEQHLTINPGDFRRLGEALAAFLKGRVPPEEPRVFGPDISAAQHNRRLGFNACRDIVLRGRNR